MHPGKIASLFASFSVPMKFHSISGGFHGFLGGIYGVFTAFSRYFHGRCFLVRFCKLALAIFGRYGLHSEGCVERCGHTS